MATYTTKQYEFELEGALRGTERRLMQARDELRRVQESAASEAMRIVKRLEAGDPIFSSWSATPTDALRLAIEIEHLAEQQRLLLRLLTQYRRIGTTEAA